MTGGHGAADGERMENLRAEYQQVCSHFSLLTDIRFKLLAFLPIGTGAGAALAVDWDAPAQTALIGLFGLVVTCGIAFYNKRNDQLYSELVGRAAGLERQLGLKEGGFAHRPRSWLAIGPLEVNHGKIWWIYAASLVAWLFILLYALMLLLGLGPLADPPVPNGALALVLAIVTVVIGFRRVAERERKHQENLRNAARRAVKFLLAIPMDERAAAAALDDGPWAPFLEQVRIVAGQKGTAKQRSRLENALRFYLGDAGDLYWDRPHYGDCCNERAAAQLTGLLSDMPARWIYDVASGRRG